MPLHFSIEPKASDADKAFVEESIYAFNLKQVPVPYHPINIFLRDEQQNIRGGIIGGCWGGWFHINFVWVEEALRGQGYGTQLLEQAEAEARQIGCHGAFLETHSFQAPELYKRQGYEVVGELADYPSGYTFYVLRKML
jgi:ribosomal protein S18 acetylase RimI-like enzyme